MSLARVRYRESQRLIAPDLLAEQDYHRLAWLEHQQRPHRRGVLFGLGLDAGEGHTAALERGAAVDEAGRLLVVPETVDLTNLVLPGVQAEAKRRVWIAFGEEASSVRQRGRRVCGPGQHNRVSEHVRILVTAEAEEAPNAVGLGAFDVSAGGVITVDPEESRNFTALLAGGVGSPRGDVNLQVGAVNRRDRNHFAVSVKDGEDWKTRLAIRRDGLTEVSGALEVLGGRASLELSTASEDTLLRLEARRTGRGGALIKVTVTHAAGLTLKLSSPEIAEPEEHSATVAGIVEVLNRESALVTASWVSSGPSDPVPALPDPVEDVPLRVPFSALRLDTPLAEPGAGRTTRCDESPTGRAGGPCVTPGALSFSRSSPPTPALSPWHISRVQLPEEEGGREQLRVSLGEHGEKADRAPRFEAGLHRESTKAFLPLLSISAGKRATIHGSRNPLAVEGSAVLAVTGRVTQQPLPNDPSNPLFKQLLVLASISGFISIAFRDRSLVVQFVDLPPVIPAGQPWEYSVSISHSSSTARLIWLVETLAPESGSLPSMTFLRNQMTGPKAPVSVDVVHPTGWPDAGPLPIRVAVTAKTSFSVFNIAEAEIVVEDALEISLAGVADVALPDVAWQAQIRASNPSGREIEVTGLEFAVSKPGEEPTDFDEVFSGSVVIDAGDESDVGPPLDIPASDADILITLRAAYRYRDAPTFSWTQKAAKVVIVERHLEVTVADLPDSISSGSDWSYDLELRNGTVADVTGWEVVQILRDQNGDEIESRVVGSGTAIGPDETEEIAVTNTDGGVATSISVTLEVSYEQEGHAWTYTEEAGMVSVVSPI